MPESTLITSCKLRKIRDALPPGATVARLGLARIIIEVEVLEACRVAMNRTIKNGLYQRPPEQEPLPVPELTTQGALDV